MVYYHADVNNVFEQFSTFEEAANWVLEELKSDFPVVWSITECDLENDDSVGQYWNGAKVFQEWLNNKK